MNRYGHDPWEALKPPRLEYVTLPLSHVSHIVMLKFFFPVLSGYSERTNSATAAKAQFLLALHKRVIATICQPLTLKAEEPLNQPTPETLIIRFINENF